jgi:hypothetical protein
MQHGEEQPRPSNRPRDGATARAPFAVVWSILASLFVLAAAVVVFSWSKWLVIPALAAAAFALGLTSRRFGVEGAAVPLEHGGAISIGSRVGGVVLVLAASLAFTQGRVGGLIVVVLLMLADLVERLGRWRHSRSADSLLRLAGDPRHAVVPIAVKRWRAGREDQPRGR